MFPAIFKKDFKLALSNPMHIGIIAIYPIIIIVVFGFTMRNNMDNNYGTFDNAKVFYYRDNASEEMLSKFTEISEIISDKIDVEFEEISDYDKACDEVESSKAYAVIKIEADGYDYFRSDFNETYGGDIVRTLFVELTNNEANTNTVVQNISLNIKKANADVYYTFAGLGIAILFLALVMSNSFGRDYSSGTIEKFMMSKAGASSIILSKLTCGAILGLIQIAIALSLSTSIFKIDWNHNIGMIILVHIVMLLFSLCFGLMVGILIPNETTTYLAICYFAMLSNYLGGSITPVYLLERIPILKYIIKISPIYWTNQSLTNLYNGTNDSKTRYCIIVLLAFAVVFMAVTFLYTSSKSKSISANAGYKNQEVIQP